VHLRASAPAKVNLSLLVGPPKADGYHDLFTVFAPIDVFDQLDFRLHARAEGLAGAGGREGRQGELRVSCAGVAGEVNLALLALRALERATGWAIEGNVAIDKGIPLGAGLGGGSSDAAVALRAGQRAIAERGGPAPDEAGLRAIACTLGADVPFFLDPRPALGRGVGEILRPLSLSDLDMVVVFLHEHLSTPVVYDAFDALRAPEESDSFERRAAEAESQWRRLAKEWASGALSKEAAAARVAGLLLNDLEEASIGLLPAVRRARDLLQQEGSLGALMSGSGSTVLGVCRSADEARDLAARLEARGMSARPVTTGRGPSLP
jgi:4-diphosphocytidyl-2-C-methyl-D-erythritol kinase